MYIYIYIYMYISYKLYEYTILSGFHLQLCWQEP